MRKQTPCGSVNYVTINYSAYIVLMPVICQSMYITTVFMSLLLGLMLELPQ